MNHRKILVVMLALLVFTALTRCGGVSEQRKVSYPGSVTPQMQTEFDQVEEQYRKRNYEYAFSGYENFIQTYPYNELTDESFYKQGKIFFLTERFIDAAQKFAALAAKTPNSKYQARAWHMAGYANFRADQFEQALIQLKQVNDLLLAARMRAQYYSLIIESARFIEAERPLADENMIKLYSLYEDYADQSLKNIRGGHTIDYFAVKQMLEAWLDTPMSSAQIPLWMKAFPKDSPAKGYVDYKIAKIYYEENSKKAARLFLNFVKRYPKNRLAEKARKILAKLGTAEEPSETTVKDARFKVGALLPLTGRYETYGLSVLDGVRCAVGTDNTCGDASGIEVVIRDPGITPESVQQAVLELAEQDVVAIIGPLSGKLALDAGVIASEKKIPIFPITQTAEATGQSDYIFQVGIQPKQQVQALVRAGLSRGLKSFGVFHPNNKYGQVMAELFTEEVKAAGGKITALAEYNRISTDLIAEARKLKKSIGHYAKPDKGVGFDALFIPDSYQIINALVGALEFNGITKIPLLGTNAWNDPGLTLAIADKFPNSFFIDLYDGSSESKTVKDFKEKFAASFGRAPRVLEAYGYDIMMMIRASAARKGERHIKDGLDEEQSYKGVTGIRGFKAGEGTVIESMVLRVKAEGVEQ